MAKKVQVIVFSKGDQNEVLLLRMREDRMRGIQNVTGLAEIGEDYPAAAKRELLEETGIDATPIPLDFKFEFEDRWERFCTEEVFYVILDHRPTQIKICTKEHEEAYWVSVEEITPKTYHHNSSYEAFLLAKEKLND